MVGSSELGVCGVAIPILILQGKSARIQYVRALVVKGLSRLPVTEEIAGSNPVERARKNTLPFGSVFFLVLVSGLDWRLWQL